MKIGDTVNGYRLITRPCNEDAGKSVWAFAERDGTEYFIKRFLEPKRPQAGSGASARSRELRLAECRDFERRHSEVGEALRQRRSDSGSGNLVVPLHFFVAGSTYYKVTEKVVVADADPTSFSAKEKLVLLRTLALSVRVLHGIGIVHGDLKPTNVLIERRPDATAFHPAKLIDFDDSYLTGRPPAPGVVGGDQLFGAPELLRYMREDPGVPAGALTVAGDMFSVGLLAHYYLTRRLPDHDSEFGVPGEAVAAGAALAFDERLPAATRDLLGALTSREPAARPSIDAFLAAMDDARLCELAGSPLPATPAASSRPSGSRLHMPSFEAPPPGRSAAEAVRPPDGAPRRSRLKINLGGGDHP
ncbi:protein kinase domain-containing protein [Actinomadura parmotrematis]|uniref:Serine/threonine protein kinase n=1 Tax=Actinomadura parmotrematis TaxID=2864039 RepID=A0ABS7FZS0_9ACTN|nr:serine/threonine protein kinase [Actinomadura parmotrematis]MBW8485939.1 serine/threonine protein kinase [Actinomadura parmotrematis]